jgi:hypothetical protein
VSLTAPIRHPEINHPYNPGIGGTLQCVAMIDDEPCGYPAQAHLVTDVEQAYEVHRTQHRAFGSCDSLTCYPRYVELEYEGPQGPVVMTFAEWAATDEQAVT